MDKQGTTYTLFFSLSILTDERRFGEMLAQTGSLPFHNLKQTDWEGLGIKIRDTLMDNYPEIRDCVTVKLFDDSLESATKGTLTESQAFSYLKTLVARAQDGNFQAHDLRADTWMTTYTQSAPPQDFNGVIVIDDDGSEDILESTVNGMLRHFYTAGESRFGGLGALPMIFSGQINDSSGFSTKMLEVFIQTFDHPFSNDVRPMILNEGQQRNIATAHSMHEL
ncbi:hypothetical protein [Marinobacter salicampi]|uniref:hypothetical protein n=1 Tax=Marinobacter salicampi TaxID=435907 RepID=UPI00140AF3ED|nr:hypothetical protein [Marinobacter salicampi]